jgi:hypothetical protein
MSHKKNKKCNKLAQLDNKLLILFLLFMNYKLIKE